MKREGDFYVGGKGNRWSCSTTTEEQAILYERRLINCTDCTDCRYCTDCTDCTDCHDCRNCQYCYDCRNCQYCYNCTACTDCHDCRNCQYCYNCTACINCINCQYCYNCVDFKSNPQRIISPVLGSRSNNTHVYWTSTGDIQVVCGCFLGDLEKFREAVLHKYDETHEYIAFIDKVRQYIGI